MNPQTVLDAFLQSGLGAAPVPPQPPPPQPTGVTIAQFQSHLQQEQQIQTAIAQHFETVYAEIAAIKTFQKWIVVIQSGVMVLLIVFLWAFFPLWQQWQQQKAMSPISPPPPSGSAVP